MNIAKPMPSVLTHGGKSDDAIRHAIMGNSEVHHAQHGVVMDSAATEESPSRHLHFETEPAPHVDVPTDYPMHLHSVKDPKHTLTVGDEGAKDAALATGDWSERPMERTRNEHGRIIYQTFDESPETESELDSE